MISSAAITCPKCKVVIRSPQPIPAGKQVKCPKCSTVFKSPGSHPGTMPKPGLSAQGISKPGSQPGVVRKPGSSAQGLTAKPGSQQGVRKPGSSAQGISAKPGSQQGTVRKPGTSSQGGLRPAIGSHPGKGARKKGGRGKLVLALVLFLLLGGIGLAGYFYLGGGSSGSTSSEVASNTASTNTQTDPGKPQLSDDPLAYVPADANLIIGVDPKALLGMPFVKQGLKAAGPEVEKILADAKDTVEQAVFAFKVPPGATANPANVRPAMTFIVKWRQAGEAKNQTVSTILPGLLTGKGQTQAPTDKILLVSDLPPAELQKLGAKPVVSADTAALIRQLEKNPAWVLLPITPETRKELEGSAAMAGAMLPPELVPVIKALPTAKGISIALSSDAKHAKLTIGMACGNDKTAQDVTGSLKVLWAKNKPLLADGLKPFLAQLPPDLGTLVEDILTTTTVTAQEQTAQVSAQLSLLPLENMARNFDALIEAGMKIAAGDKTPPPPPKEKARELTAQEKRLLELTTNFRKASELPPFKENPTLHLVAQKFVEKMAKDNNGNFVDLEELEKELKEAGYKVAKVDDKALLAGNTGFSEGAPNPDGLYNVWINTKDPLANLREKLDETGIAFFINKDKNQVFYLQIYATPHKEENKD